MPIVANTECPFCRRMHERVMQLQEDIARAELANLDLREQLAREIETAWDLANDTRVSMVPFHHDQASATAADDRPKLFSQD